MLAHGAPRRPSRVNQRRRARTTGQARVCAPTRSAHGLRHCPHRLLILMGATAGTVSSVLAQHQQTPGRCRRSRVWPEFPAERRGSSHCQGQPYYRTQQQRP